MSSERGSLPLESVIGIVFLMMLALGSIQVTLLLFAGNVVKASAHEAARAAIEIGADEQAAATVARDSVRRSVGGLVEDLEVSLERAPAPQGALVAVDVRATVSLMGPVPFTFPLSGRARVLAARPPR